MYTLSDTFTCFKFNLLAQLLNPKFNIFEFVNSSLSNSMTAYHGKDLCLSGYLKQQLITFTYFALC